MKLKYIERIAQRT